MPYSVKTLPSRFLRTTGIIGAAAGAAISIALYNPASLIKESGNVTTAAEALTSRRSFINFLIVQTKDPRPEMLVAGCTIFGIALVDLIRQSRPHRHQELVFLAYVIVAAALSILDCLNGSPIPSALRRILPATMLCAQLTNMAVGGIMDPDDEQSEMLRSKRVSIAGDLKDGSAHIKSVAKA